MTGSTEQLRDWLALYPFSGIGPGACRRLVNHFGSPARVLGAHPRDFLQVHGIGEKTLATLQQHRHSGQAVLKAEQEVEHARQLGISIITIDDPRYPPLLAEINNPPVVLYVRGSVQALTETGISIVGSRAATGYGKDVARRLARDLSLQGLTIISGLAMGIDTEAHRGALAAGGRTIAVQACGLDSIYPASNTALAKDIMVNGAIISEYPLGTQPEAFRFPARNRIISGLGLGVIVVEAANKSGSLITAEHALEQGREVFAIPGRVDSFKSKGTHGLLKQGAKLVQGIEDILEELPVVAGQTQARPAMLTAAQNDVKDLAPDEHIVFHALDVYPQTIDEIVRATAFPPQKVHGLLLHLELKGIVEALPGKCYRRNAN